MPDVLLTGKLNEQINYIEERTKIFEYYRAIREDMFQQIKKNTLDTLTAAKTEITTLTLSKNKYNIKIDSLNSLITDARSKLDEAVRTKNNIKVLGIDVNKFAYNSVMWIILAGFAVLLTIGFLVFRRNLSVMRHTRKDLEDLKTEFEAYRKQSREAREKMSMEHFKEIKKLRAQGTEPRAQGAEPRAQGAEPGAQGAEPRAQGAEPRAQGAEHGTDSSSVALSKEESGIQRAETEEQGKEIPGNGNSEFRADGEESRLRSDPKKPRKRRTQSPGQGSIEL